jgi:hypothetical protein
MLMARVLPDDWKLEVVVVVVVVVVVGCLRSSRLWGEEYCFSLLLDSMINGLLCCW